MNIKFLLLLVTVLIFSWTASAQTNDQRTLVLVVGAEGESEYGEQFSAWSDLWKQATEKGGLKTIVVSRDTNTIETDLTRLLSVLTNEVAQPAGELWLVFIGHGTYDGRAAKFNLRGPDISSATLAETLKPNKRTLVVIDCSSASGPFLNALSAPGRVIITATRSGNEANITRFGGYLAHAMVDPAGDLDKDDQTSLLEAYVLASRQVDQFYKEAGRLATEHALLDDNGDGLGTPADFFLGVRAIKPAAAGKSVDGVRAHQLNLVRSTTEQNLSPELRARRNELEKKLGDLRTRKADLKEEEYYQQLENIMVETAKLYQSR